MSVSGRRPTSSQQQAEISCLPSLKSCLLNLPASLVSVLLNANAITQNVIVELQFAANDAKSGKSASKPKSVFFGWTGMQSQTKLAPLIGRDSGRGIEKEVPIVEIDTQVARVVGLESGMKVGIQVHLDPPMAHTINIEPATATDWEIIELHARFLETNFLNQVRALPNPAAGDPHPLTLHLTPTSTANIIITSLTPAPSTSQAFVKISPDAEVIVAPKTRQPTKSSGKDAKSVGSTGRKSVGGRSTASASRHRSTHDEEKARPPIFLRGLTRKLENEWLEDGSDEMRDEGLKVWLDREHLLSKTLRGVTSAIISVVKPPGLQEPVDPQTQVSAGQMPATRVVAKLCAWEDAPDNRHVALSSMLCSTLAAEGIVGSIIRIDPAPTPLPKTASALKEPSQQASKDAIIKKLRITPFASTESSKKSAGFKFGGESKSERDEAARRIKSIFAKSILEGPLTDGMMLPAYSTWPGGIIDFEPTPPGDPNKIKTNWLVGADRKLDIIVQPEVAPPKFAKPPGEPLPEKPPVLVGIDKLMDQTKNSLLHTSSVLLIGGLGSGKSSVAQLLAHQLRNEYLFNTIYFPCRTLVTEETRVKTIKEVLHRVFATAAWGARLGGRAIVILDDLDRLCPVETELQVDANGRSRQVSELLCTLVRQFCGRDSGVVLLATAQGKEAVNNVVVGGHVVRDIVSLKAPTKDGRRQVLEMLVRKASSVSTIPSAVPINSASAWMEESVSSRPTSSNGFPDQTLPADEVRIDSELDLLDIAGQTDGYMPGDLSLLVSRARSEALIRAVSDTSDSDDITLSSVDFSAALKGFTPASLRGVSLHSSSTTFSSIGGLRETRQTLLETLQYPTTYAPLFAKCPLRLRSGLLLYGYPGCGKTLLASAVAGECGLNFISVKGPEILNKYIGASEKSVRDLFERAEAAKPCVLFFDEFDSIAPKRGHDSTGVTDRVVNMLLTMMDGAEGLSGVYVLAATSRPDLIDPALLRPGRLDKSLICDLPDRADRLDILQAVATKLTVAPDVLDGTAHPSLAEFAEKSDGYSGADLQAVLYNAHLEAIQEVLGKETAALGSGDKTPTKSPSSSTSHSEFTYFRLGEVSNPAPPTPPAILAAERASIAAKLAQLASSRRKSKPAANAAAAPASEDVTVTIHARHLQASFGSTRASISAQERRRLGRVYAEFVQGRNGEMSDGQGGSEVGGRSSLM